MMEIVTPIFQHGAGIAIELNTQFFGINCKLYYPKDENSDKIDDKTYSDEPDDELKLLIPDIYNLRRTPQGGVNDNLFQEAFITYVKHDHHIPFKTKIVAISDKLGTMQFIVDETDSVTTFVDSIYRELTLIPYMSFRNNDIDVVNNSKELREELLEDSLENNYSIDDFYALSEPDENKLKYKFRRID